MHPGRVPSNQGRLAMKMNEQERASKRESKVDFFDGSWVQHILTNYS
jgi:hypothetical protein